jgi:DNA primase
VSEWYDAAAVKRANPIVAVLARYGLSLRREGRRFVGRCPFHPDRRTPSLHAYPSPDPARDSWFCFGCWSGGDAITFVMRLERLEYSAACARLGGQPTDRTTNPLVALPEPPRRWDRLTLQEQLVLNRATAVYQASLRREPRALAYLQGRGLTDETIDACRLGYADGRELERVLRRESALDVAAGLGLLRPAERGDRGGGAWRELLAGRIVVPELRGSHVVWMVGRWVGDPGERRPKYLGLPGEKPVLGLERVVGCPEAFVVEGVFGYLLGVSWGLPVCSPCGTYLAADRLGFLASTRTVWGLLDPDEAGRAAARRFGELLGRRWRPLWLPGGREVDDLAQRPDGRAELLRCLAEARIDDETTTEERAHAV